MDPPATIVVPLLRQVDGWLARSVRSALAQTVPCEVLVVTAPGTPPSNQALLETPASRQNAGLASKV